MNVNVTFDYGMAFSKEQAEAFARIATKTLDQVCRCKKGADGLVEYEIDDHGKMKAEWGSFEVDLDSMLTLGLPFKVESKAPGSLIGDLMTEIKKLRHEVQAVGYREAQFNEKCSVHVPGMALMLIDEVMVRTDSCTDIIQEELNGGWRILAICPQPDGRRPDYVLGRVKNG